MSEIKNCFKECQYYSQVPCGSFLDIGFFSGFCKWANRRHEQGWECLINDRMRILKEPTKIEPLNCDVLKMKERTAAYIILTEKINELIERINTGELK